MSTRLRLACDRARAATLRDWLEYVAETAIDMLDALDAADEGRELDEDFEPGDEVLR
ncbi:hypothetical protein [Caulobacter sp. BK020]|uniref:hypothetical protein n=1 Tax=Caulobacter sp. BK020 TaxID=2512117 RepID=UPI0010E36FD5|nr:hypothetical protein [Caulobacter sp. BK020]TCS14560.1 hypothetical protein EV278_107209 [Caulobacter sp. BK020]